MAENGVDESYIKQMVFEIIKRNSGLLQTPEPDMNLYDDIGMDVLDVVECCMEIEEELGEKTGNPAYITALECDTIKTVGDMLEVAQNAAEGL